MTEPDQFWGGWGEETDTNKQRLYRERIANDTAKEGAAATLYTHPAPRAETAIERMLRERFQFDQGWAFWEAEKAVYGYDLEPGPQNIGNCVGYSHVLALGAKVAHELLVEGDPEDVLGDDLTSPVPYVPYSYGVGRVFIGGGRLRGDGSLCSWQIDGTLKHGFLPSDTEGLPGPYPQSSSSVGRSWGRSASILNEWKPKAAPYKLQNSWDVKSAEDLYKAICEDKTPCQICSSWGFRPSGTKDGMTIYSAGGRWAHSMQIIGMICFGGSGDGLGNGGRWYVVVRNQWGRNAHRDPGRGIPRGSFVIGVDTFSKWVKAAHCATIGEIEGRQLTPGFPF